MTDQMLSISQLLLGASKKELSHSLTEKQIMTYIAQLGLQVDRNNKKDVSQIGYLLTNVIEYPSTEKAILHQKANRLGDYDIPDKQNQQMNFLTDRSYDEMKQYCSCCGFVRQTQQLKLCSHSIQEVHNIGCSTYFYFKTIKDLTLLMFIAFLVLAIFAIITNILASIKFSQKDSSNAHSSYLSYLVLSLGSKEIDNTDENQVFFQVQSWLGLLVCIIWAIVFLRFKHKEKQYQMRSINDMKSAADYSIVIEKMPTNMSMDEVQAQLKTYADQIQSYIQQPIQLKIAKYCEGKPFYLEESNIKDEQFIRISKENKIFIERMTEWIVERKQNQNFLTPQNQRKKTYDSYQQLQLRRKKKYQQTCQKIIDQFKQQNKQPKTTVFVTFETNMARNVIIQENYKTSILERIKRCLCCRGARAEFLPMKGGVPYQVAIRPAPQPEDVLWMNIGVSDCQVYSRKLITYVISLILLGASFGAVYGLQTIQFQTNTNTYVSIIISLIIAVINVLLGFAIRILSVYERDYTFTDYQTSLALKSIVAQVFNSIIIPFLANYLIKQNIYQTNGLADDIFFMGITNSLFPPILKVVNIYYIYTRFAKWYYGKPNSKLYLNQSELNTYYEYVDFQVGFQYIYVINLYLFTCFYISLQPIICLFAFIGYICMYFVSKFTLFHRNKRPVPGTSILQRTMQQLVYLGPLIYVLGNFTWSQFLPQGSQAGSVPNIMTVGVAGFIILVPYSLLHNCIYTKENTLTKSYSQNRIFLPSQYDRLNPATAEAAYAEYISFLQSKQNQMRSASTEMKQGLAQIFEKQAQVNHTQRWQGPVALGNFFGNLKKNRQDNILFNLTQPNHYITPFFLKNTLLNPKNPIMEDNPLFYFRNNNMNDQHGKKGGQAGFEHAIANMGKQDERETKQVISNPLDLLGQQLRQNYQQNNCLPNLNPIGQNLYHNQQRRQEPPPPPPPFMFPQNPMMGFNPYTSHYLGSQPQNPNDRRN